MKETESSLMATQDQTLATKACRVTILKQQGSEECRICNEREETVMHILSECSKLAQAEYKKGRHYGSLGTYVANMVLSLPTTGMNIEQKEWRSCRISTLEPTVLQRLDTLILC